MLREWQGSGFKMAMTRCSECSGSLSSKAASCPHCGAKQRRTSGCAWFVLWVFVFIGFIFFLGVNSDSTSTRTATPASSDAWIERFNPEITRALVKNKIRDCGEYYYKPNGSNEYFVKCTRDGRAFSYYIVFTASGEVMGPYDRM